MRKKPAVFLDRDGVLTVEKSYVTKLEDLEIFPFARETIEKIHKAEYYAIVITNQSAIARGMLSVEELERMNIYLMEQTGVDAVYYCPHHPEGKIKQYAFECDCRKPKIGMIEKACKDFEIDLNHSYFVGDRATDIMTGKVAGVYTVLVETGYGLKRLEKKVKADYIYENVYDFANEINCLNRYILK